MLLQVAQAFLTALQNDERANYQLDVKFQESYLHKVVSLLQCHLSEGAILESDAGDTETNNSPADENGPEELEEGELTNSRGEWFYFVTIVPFLVSHLLMLHCIEHNFALQNKRKKALIIVHGVRVPDTSYLISESQLSTIQSFLMLFLAVPLYLG